MAIIIDDGPNGQVILEKRKPSTVSSSSRSSSKKSKRNKQDWRRGDLSWEKGARVEKAYDWNMQQYANQYAEDRYDPYPASRERERSTRQERSARAASALRSEAIRRDMVKPPLSGPAPPIPRQYPDVSPVDDLRRRTVNRYGLSSEAREGLYDTSTLYDITPGVPNEYLGIYQPRKPFRSPRSIEVSGDYGPKFSEQTLQHEGAHKWYFEDLNQSELYRYWKDWASIPQAVRAWSDYSGGESPGRASPLSVFRGPLASVPTRESYAEMAEKPWEITEAQRDLYYPGMFESRDTPPLPQRMRSPFR